MANRQIEPSIQELLFFILTIIHFEADKQKFINDFFDKCFSQTLVTLLTSLDDTQKEEVKKSLTQISDSKRITFFLSSYFGESAYTAALKLGVQVTWRDFLKMIQPLLSQNEKILINRKLQSVFL